MTPCICVSKTLFHHQVDIIPALTISPFDWWNLLTRTLPDSSILNFGCMSFRWFVFHFRIDIRILPSISHACSNLFRALVRFHCRFFFAVLSCASYIYNHIKHAHWFSNFTFAWWAIRQTRNTCEHNNHHGCHWHLGKINETGCRPTKEK